MIPADLEIAFRNLDWIIKGTKTASKYLSSIRFVDTSIVFSENFKFAKLNEEDKKVTFHRNFSATNVIFNK